MKRNPSLVPGIFFLVMSTIALAQPDKIIPPSPTAASLVKYADIPVGLYTGTGSVNIPLYDLKGPNLSLPLSLSYHAGGVRVDENSSWVGLGWALNAGGTITRTAKGMRDEEHGGYLAAPALPQAPQIDVFFREVIANRLDPEPDIFFFNFNGRSGKFYLDKLATPSSTVVTGHSIPYQDIKIKCDYVPDGLNNFSITTEDGVEYIFDVTETTESKNYYYDDLSDIAGPILIDAPTTQQRTSWYLREIRAPFGNEKIVFNYVDERSKYQTTKSGEATYGMTGRAVNRTMRHADITLYNKRLASITYERIGVTVEFIPGPVRTDLIQLPDNPGPAKSLAEIVVKHGNPSVIRKRFQLVTTYFTHPDILDEPEARRYLYRRLRLDKVIELSGGAEPESLPPYVFKYNTIPLPPKDAETQDHWGYYNGPADPVNSYIYYSKHHMMPEYYGEVDNSLDRYIYGKCDGTSDNVSLARPVFLDIEGVNREPNSASMQAGILTQVKYPTGGTTTLDYEAHQYGYVADEDITENIYNQEVPGAYIERPWENNPTGDEEKVYPFVAPRTGAYKISFEVEFGYRNQTEYETGISYNKNEVELVRASGGPAIIKVYRDHNNGIGDIYIEVTPEGTPYAGAVKLTNYHTDSQINFAEIVDTGGDQENYGRRSGRGFMTVRLTQGITYKLIARRKYEMGTYCSVPGDPNYCVTNNNLATINFDRALNNDEIIGVKTSFLAGGLRVLRKTETPAFGGTPVVTDYSYQYTDQNYEPTSRSSGCLLSLPDHTNTEPQILYQEYQTVEHPISFKDVNPLTFPIKVITAIVGALIPGEDFMERLFNWLGGDDIVAGCTGGTYHVYTLFSINSDYYMPLSTTQGSHLGYREVTVSQTGNGFTVTKFRSGFEAPDRYPTDYTIVVEVPGTDLVNYGLLYSDYESRFKNSVPKLNRDWERGFELEKIVLDNGKKVLSHEINNYEFPVEETIDGYHLFWVYPSRTSQLPVGAVEYTAYQISSGKPRIASKSVVTRTPSGEAMTTYFTYAYGSAHHNNVTKQIQTIVEGPSPGQEIKIETRYEYVADKQNPNNPPTDVYNKMVSKNILYPPFKTEMYRQSTLVEGQISNYRNDEDNGNPVLSTIEVSRGGSYKVDQNFIDYDLLGNLIHFSRSNDTELVFLWGYQNTLPIASINNASPNRVAYSSFESDDGTWAYNSSGIVPDGGKIGKRCFNLASYPLSKTIPAGEYVLSYWAKGSATVTGMTPSASTETLADDNGWVLHEILFNLSAPSSIAISGTTGSSIDEVRLFPADASMTTYVHDPLVGMTFKNDPNNVWTEYRYDKFGRLEATFDHEGHVTKKYTYHYAGQ